MRNTITRIGPLVILPPLPEPPLTVTPAPKRIVMMFNTRGMFYADSGDIATVTEGDNKYTVSRHEYGRIVEFHCTCPDWQPAPLNPKACRHIAAYERQTPA
jgi:hypothetical protein